MIFIGVDPGAAGGLVSLETAGDDAQPLKGMTERDIWDWFDLIRDRNPCAIGVFAVIERVGGFIQGNPAPGSAMFSFGRGYGFLLGCLTAAGIPFEEVPPQKWQKALGIPGRKKTESKTQWKNRLRGHAQRLFPDLTVTLAVADALLIAHYCQMTHGGER